MVSIKVSGLLLILSVVSCVQCQVDGSFWWTNRDLLKKASESRNNKNVDFKNEAEPSTAENVLSSVSGMDCTCVHSCKCQVAFEQSAKNGILCPATDHVCCQIIKLPIPAKCFELEAASTSSTQSPFPTTTTKTIRTTPATTTTQKNFYSDDNLIYPDDNKILQHPSLLKLYLRGRNRNELTRVVCGATLLSKTSAITAQHCIRGTRIAPNFMIKTADGQVRVITEIARHPRYYSGGLYNDLAIIKWDDSVRVNGEFTIDLPSNRIHAKYSNCSLLVAMNEEDSLSDPIQINEDAQLIRNDVCEGLIQGSKWGSRFKLHENFTCIQTNRRSSCTDNSPRDGHPLVCQQEDHHNPVLAGVMSWYSCHKNHPDVLMDIRSNMEWISEFKT